MKKKLNKLETIFEKLFRKRVILLFKVFLLTNLGLKWWIYQESLTCCCVLVSELYSLLLFVILHEKLIVCHDLLHAVVLESWGWIWGLSNVFILWKSKFSIFELIINWYVYLSEVSRLLQSRLRMASAYVSVSLT